MSTIGPCLAEALKNLDALGESNDFADFAIIGRFNTLRHLLKRGWIVDLNAERRRAYKGPKPPVNVFPMRWSLTQKGRRALADVMRQGPGSCVFSE